MWTSENMCQQKENPQMMVEGDSMQPTVTNLFAGLVSQNSHDSRK